MLKREVFLEYRIFQNDIRKAFPESWNKKHDVSLSINNSLAYLLSEKELRAALRNIFQVTKKKGLFIFSMRPYDEYVKTYPVSPPGRSFKPVSLDTEQVTFSQSYNWTSENSYICENPVCDKKNGNV